MSVVLLAAACGSGLSSKDAAKVGATEIPKWRVDTLLSQAKVTYSAQRRPFPKPGSSDYRLLQQRATAFLVVGAMYADKARREGIEVSDQAVGAAVRHRLNGYGPTRAQQEQALRAQGSTVDELTAEVRQELIQQQIQKTVYARVHVTDADVQAYYDAHKAKYSSPPQRTVRMILVHSRQLANRLAVQLHSGAKFTELVRRYSEDAGTKANGGKVTIVKGQASADIEQVAFSLQPGQISRPFTSGDRATRIFQALGPVQPERVTPLSEIADVIRGDASEEKHRDALAAWQLGVKKDYCGGDEIDYAKGFKPSRFDDPCGQSRITPQ